MEKFATGGIVENGLFIERENDIGFVGKIDDKMIPPHSEKISDSIGKNKDAKTKDKMKKLKEAIRNGPSSQEVYATFGLGINGKKLQAEKE